MQSKPPAAGVEKTTYPLSSAGGVVIYYVWEKKDLRCFERICIGYKQRSGKGDGGSFRMGEQPLRKKRLLLWWWATVLKVPAEAVASAGH